MDKLAFYFRGKVESFDNPNGTKTIALIEERYVPHICVALNYLHRKNENSCLRWNGSVWWDIDKYPGRQATTDEIFQLVNAIARQDGMSKLEIDFDKAIVSFEQELKPINWKEKE